MTALDARKRWLALYILCVLMIVLDTTIVNVARSAASCCLAAFDHTWHPGVFVA